MEKKLFAVAITATRVTHDGSVRTSSVSERSMAVIAARSKEEAIGIGYMDAGNMFLSADGWDHYVSVCEIPELLIEQLGYTR